MKARLTSNERNVGLQAALSRFPAKSLQIRQLLLGRESFRGLCEDLAVADGALAKVGMYPTPYAKNADGNSKSS